MQSCDCGELVKIFHSSLQSRMLFFKIFTVLQVWNQLLCVCFFNNTNMIEIKGAYLDSNQSDHNVRGSQLVTGGKNF